MEHREIFFNFIRQLNEANVPYYFMRGFSTLPEHEWSFYCDRGDEPLACTKCDHKIARYPDDEKKNEMTDLPKKVKPLLPEELKEMLAWCPAQEQADNLFAWTREKGIVAVCLKKIERMEAELDELKKELGKI